MVKQFNVFNRRILTFSAICPGKFVSFPSLITSLLTVAQRICNYKSKTFVTNKKNARSSIRLVENLLIVLEELHRGQSRITSSSILSLSELHFIFQKIQLLLEDCSRDDAKLWMLMKAKNVSGQFQSFVRAIGVALEVLPVEELDFSVEVKELFELVKNQAMKCEFIVEMDDSRVAEKVGYVLDQFKDEIPPEPRDFRMVLEYLGILSWGECNKEVKFLQNELVVEWLTDEKKEMGFCSDLMGFMIYSRCKLFDAVDSAYTPRFRAESNSEMIRGLNPEDFRCPITLELMTDPVTLATGHTYDRSSILKWFSSGNHTCPKTGEKLESIDLVPNATLKKLIKLYCLENGIHFPESSGRKRGIARMVDVSSTAAHQAMKLLANDLVGRLIAERKELQNKIVCEIRMLTKTSPFNRSCLVDAGAVPPLLVLLSSTHASVQENAIAALMNLSKYSGGKKMIVENGGLVLILDVLQEGLSAEARQHAAGTLFYLASVEEYRVMTAEIPRVFPGLMDLLRNGRDRGKKIALAAIFSLLTQPGNRCRALETGLIPLLTTLLRSSQREDLITDSLAVLATLAERKDGTVAILRAGASPTIIEVFASSDSKTAKEYCVSLLLSFCLNGGVDAVSLLVNKPSLMTPLYTMLTEGTTRARKGASFLIRTLHEFSEKSSSGFNPPAVRFIHV